MIYKSVKKSMVTYFSFPLQRTVAPWKLGDGGCISIYVNYLERQSEGGAWGCWRYRDNSVLHTVPPPPPPPHAHTHTHSSSNTRVLFFLIRSLSFLSPSAAFVAFVTIIPLHKISSRYSTVGVAHKLNDKTVEFHINKHALKLRE